jgi:hypothetical protein
VEFLESIYGPSTSAPPPKEHALKILSKFDRQEMEEKKEAMEKTAEQHEGEEESEKKS